MTTKRKTTKKQAKPKTKIVYRTKKVYVEKEDNDNPLQGVNQMIGTGMGAVIGIGVASAIAKGLNNI
jgi:hypothetical protein